MYPSLSEFKKLAKRGNVIPVVHEVQADLETPVSAYLKIVRGGTGYLLESVESQESVGRYSFVAGDPALVFSSKGGRVTVFEPRRKGTLRRSYTCDVSPFDELKRLMSGYRFVDIPGLPRFCGGFVGYIGYDMVRFVERLPEVNPDDLGVPDSIMMLSDTLVIFDHVNRTLKIVANAILKGPGSRGVESAYRDAGRRVRDVLKRLETPLEKETFLEAGLERPVRVASNMTRSAFMGAVRRAKEHIRRGDIIQVVLSQRFTTKFSGDAFDVYRSLRAVNPSPYMFFLKFDEVTLVGSSPELLVRSEEGRVMTRPIAGTRPRGRDEAEDARLAAELKKDAKERAEHLMLVDLGRNDVGRVSAPGSVRVDRFMEIERYSHVMHLVSHVTGRLKKGCHPLDALVACFPAGTLSGAPKVRAMEIIEDLEVARRGPYGGAVAYFGFSGNFDSGIIIRTLVIKGDKVYVQAGAGIVADSDPAREYQETVNKARACFKALGCARTPR